MESEKIIQKQIQSAPKEIKNLLAGDTWSQVVNEMAQKNNFSDEQKTALENEVVFVLLGMELASDLRQNIQSSLLIAEVLAQQISSEISDKVLKSVEHLLPKEIEEDSEVTNQEPQKQPESLLPEIPPEDLPAVVPTNLPIGRNEQYAIDNGQKKELEKTVQPDQTSYPQGMDPYREPIE